jgi:hypothetical protein
LFSLLAVIVIGVGLTTCGAESALSYRSRLIDMAASGKHYDVKVDPVSLRRLIAWVDAMEPYRGAEEIRTIPDPDFEGIRDLAIQPRMQTAPKVTRP